MHDKMKRIAFIAIVVGALLSLKVQAQQDPMYTQYMFNMLTVNPGYAGSRDALTLAMLHRNQWVGMEGAPKTTTLSAHTPLRRQALALGVSMVYDEIGPVKQTGLYVDLAARIKLTEKSRISVGLKTGFNNLNSNLSNLNVIDPNDPAFQYGNVNRFMPNVGLGAYYQRERFYAGISMPKFFENTIYEETGGSVSRPKEIRHLFFITGFVIDITEEIKFKPSILVKAVDAAPLSGDLNLSFLFLDKLWLGVYGRYGDSFGGLVGVYVTPQFMIGYSYDYSTTELQKYNSGSHEISLVYDFIFQEQRLKSPRYF